MEPLRFHGNDVVLFHILDPEEIRPVLKGPALLVDLETDQQIEVIPEYTKTTYLAKMEAHIEQLRSRTRGAGGDHRLPRTHPPLEEALPEQLSLRPARDAWRALSPALLWAA